jgi:pre-mRNA-splicing factor 38A
MANKTLSSVQTIHGTNPQFLIEKIIRGRIYDSPYWKEHCFGLNEETLVDKAMELKYALIISTFVWMIIFKDHSVECTVEI